MSTEKFSQEETAALTGEAANHIRPLEMDLGTDENS